MDIKSFGELIEWTRDLHTHLAQCLGHCATRHEEERAGALLEYLASHESELARIVEEFEGQSASNTLETRVYDYLRHNPIETPHLRRAIRQTGFPGNLPRGYGFP